MNGEKANDYNNNIINTNWEKIFTWLSFIILLPFFLIFFLIIAVIWIILVLFNYIIVGIKKILAPKNSKNYIVNKNGLSFYKGAHLGLLNWYKSSKASINEFVNYYSFEPSLNFNNGYEESSIYQYDYNYENEFEAYEDQFEQPIYDYEASDETYYSYENEEQEQNYDVPVFKINDFVRNKKPTNSKIKRETKIKQEEYNQQYESSPSSFPLYDNVEFYNNNNDLFEASIDDYL